MQLRLDPLIPVFLVSGLAGAAIAADSVAPVMWYTQPAKTGALPAAQKIPIYAAKGGDARYMTEALPIGNGRIGALVFGGTATERLVLNDSSLWTGGDNPSGDYGSMGAYQTLGNVWLTQPGHEQVTGYRRDLDLATAIARVSYTVGGVAFQRELFASPEAGIIGMRLTADKPGSHSGHLLWQDAHAKDVQIDGNRLTASGGFDNGLRFATRIQIIPEGGTCAAKDGGVAFTGCNALTILMTAATNYAFAPEKQFTNGIDPLVPTAQRLDAAQARTWEQLRTASVAAHRAAFDRVQLDLGAATEAQRAMPTDARRVAASTTFDPEMEALLFAYGRYLMIGSSRPGNLPANLQGLWNDSNAPAWHSDYHANINIQMNYWPAEVANLGEFHEPLFDLIDSQIPLWRKATTASKDYARTDGKPVTGWAVRTSHNITGGMGWKWDKTANAWYAQHFWEHYDFGRDRVYLEKTAWPVLKEISEFWLAHLKALPDGRLVVPNSWSPEHGPTEDGVAYSQQIVWELFANTVLASEALGIEPELRARLVAARDKLVGPQVGSWGQLLEWMTEKKNAGELDTPKDAHRHTSHLFAVFPGRQISVTKTPEFATAAKVSLDARGLRGDVREWSLAWRCALYARLRDAASSHTTIKAFLTARHSCVNLFGNHPPMQIDGNFGMTAGFAEMLIQSHAGEIHLLPALPAEWATGSVTGLRARGGFTVSLAWQGGALTGVDLVSNVGGPCTVRLGEKTVQLTTTPGQKLRLDGTLTVR